MKQLARDGLDQPLVKALEMEAETAKGAMMSDDVTEGLAAFESRRAPVFK